MMKTIQTLIITLATISFCVYNYNYVVAQESTKTPYEEGVAASFVSSNTGGDGGSNGLLLGTVVLSTKGAAAFTASGVDLERKSSHDACIYWMNRIPIGIYMIGKGGELSASSIVNKAENRIYVAHPNTDPRSASFIPDPVSEMVYYPRDASASVHFIAYYPYKDIRNGTYTLPIDLRHQEASSASTTLDLLYANDGKVYNENSAPVDLQFHHTLAALSVSIGVGEGFNPEDLEGMSVVISNVCALGDFDLSTGSWNIPPQSSEITPYTSELGDRVYALLLPQTKPQSLTMKLKLVRGDAFVWTLPSLRMEADGLYRFHVTIKK